MKQVSRKIVYLIPLAVCFTLIAFIAAPIGLNFLKSHDECTSWIAMGDSLSGTHTILHKNRDMSDEGNMMFREVHTGLYKYIAVADTKTDLDKLLVWSGVNENGLAAASNLGNGINLWGTIGGPSTCREVLENCDSVECAYDWVADHKSQFFYENILFFADTQKAAIVEVRVANALYGTVEITSEAESIFYPDDITVTGKAGLNFRSNHFQILSNSWGYSTNSELRYERLMDLLASDYYGDIDVAVSQYISRLPDEDEDTENAICRDSTLGRMTYEINPSNPLQSILYYGDGYPCNEVYPDDIDVHGFDQSQVVVYDFESVSPSDTDTNIYVCDVDQFPFGGNTSYLNSKVEADSTAYQNISASDGYRWTTSDPGYYDETMLWVEMTVNESLQDIYHIEFVFQGAPSEDNDMVIYVKKAGGAWQYDSSWEQVGTEKPFDSDGNDGIRRVLEAYDFSDYIDSNGRITWMVGAPEGHKDEISTDFIKMEVVLD